MMILREITLDDLHSLLSFSRHAQSGFTSLPLHREYLEKKILRSQESFKKQVQRPSNELYFFVLEDTETNKVVGCSAIEAMVGINTPFYSYKIIHDLVVYPSRDIKANHDVLMLTTDFQHCSELCSLFLEEKYRSKYFGKLLSFSRLMFIAMARERFATKLFAEIRGFTKDDVFPFWEGLGKVFFKMHFDQADFLNGIGDPFVDALMPKLPIYCSLLSEETQQAIGKPHPLAEKAYLMLQQQGFEFTDYIDIFDGGPTISANINHIHAITHSHAMRISAIKKNVTAREICLLGTQSPTTCFLVDQVKILKEDEVIISEQTANLLQKMPGEEIYLYQLGIHDESLY